MRSKELSERIAKKMAEMHHIKVGFDQKIILILLNDDDG